MAELADALDSGSSLRIGGGGSSPPSGTQISIQKDLSVFRIFLCTDTTR